MTPTINETIALNIPATVSAATIDAASAISPAVEPKSNFDGMDLTKARALNFLETLVEEKGNWELTAYKSSNDQLYSLLQRCYGYYIMMCEDSNNGKSAREALKQYIENKKLSFKDSTHNITKIVKCVFGADRRRVSAYSIALRTAYANDIKPVDIAQYIYDNGGVEEIRLARSSTALTQQEKIERATAIVTSNELMTIKSADFSKLLDASNIEKQIVLIATQAANGELVINAVINNQTAAKAALVAYYGMTKKSAESAVKVENAKQPQKAAAEAVDAAVEKLAA